MIHLNEGEEANLTTINLLVDEALSEDKREGGRFDADGFSNFFPEYGPVEVREAFRIYEAIRDGRAP